MKWLVSFPVAKGVALGFVTVAVVRSGLSSFQQALIIALVSAIIGAVGVIAAAIIATRSSEEIISRQQEMIERLEDVKGVVGAKKRKRDDHAEPSP